MPQAEGVAAVMAEVVVEYLLVNHLSKPDTCGSACRGAYQRGNDGAGDVAVNRVRRADNTDNVGACFKASHNHRTDGPCNGTDGAPNLACPVSGFDMGGVAFWTDRKNASAAVRAEAVR